jgi:hypothetical protein
MEEGDIVMLLESEVGTFFDISNWLVSILLIVVSVISLKKSNSGIFFLFFAITHFLSLLGLKLLLSNNDTDPYIGSLQNSLRFSLFIFPWVISMVLLIIGIFKSRVKQN